jgi:hypothetical protein
MLEMKEHRIKVGLSREPKDIFDEIEQVSARFIRDGFHLKETIMNDFLDYIDLLFVRNIN